MAASAALEYEEKLWWARVSGNERVRQKKLKILFEQQKI